MGLFTGGFADEIITPSEVSATVSFTEAARPSAANDTIFGGAGSDTIDGGRGDDLIDGGSNADLIAGGDGADTITWNPGGGSDTVDGGAGADLLQFNTSNIGEVITLTAAVNGHAVLTRDVASIAMDLDNVERVAFGAAGGGVDRFVLGDLSTTDVTRVDIDLAPGTPDELVDRVETTGRAGDDHLVLSTANGATTVQGLTTALNIAHGEAKDVLAFAGGDGADTVDVSAFAGGLSLAFDGGAGADTLLIRGGDKAASTITLEGVSDTAMAFEINGAVSGAVLTGVESISVQGGDAGDVISAGSFVPRASLLTVDAGKGDDTVTGSTGVDTLSGGAGNDLITGRIGNDLLLGDDGDDTFVWNPGDSSDVIDGGAGADTLQFNMSNIGEVITVSATADGHAHLMRNVAGIDMDLDSVERVALGGNAGGEDRFVIGDLAATELARIDIDLEGGVSGPDNAADRIEVNGAATGDHLVLATVDGVTTIQGLSATLRVAHAATDDVLAFAGGAGDDTVDLSAAGGLGLEFDGGEGADAVLVRGDAKAANTIVLAGVPKSLMGFEVNGAMTTAVLTGVESLSIQGGDSGDLINAGGLVPFGAPLLTVEAGKGDDTVTGSRDADTLSGGAGDDLISGNTGNDLLLGGGGDDAFVWNPGDGSDSIDGGGGFDTLAFNTSNIGEVISVIDVGGAVLTRNVAGITMNLQGVEHVAIGGNTGGADTFFFGDLSATEIRRIDVDLGQPGGDGAADTVAVLGGAGADKIAIVGSGGAATVTGTTAAVGITDAEATMDRLSVSALDGADRIDATGFTGGVGLTLSGGNGEDRFVFAASSGADVRILDFQAHALSAQADVISLTTSTDHSFAEAVARHHIVQSGADVIVSDDRGAIVTLQNVLVSDLGAKDFLFG